MTPSTIDSASVPEKQGPRKSRVSWKEMKRRFVGGKYCGRADAPGLQTKTVRVVDVNLGGDVAVRFRGCCGAPLIEQPEFLTWVELAVVVEQPKAAGETPRN